MTCSTCSTLEQLPHCRTRVVPVQSLDNGGTWHLSSPRQSWNRNYFLWSIAISTTQPSRPGLGLVSRRYATRCSSAGSICAWAVQMVSLRSSAGWKSGLRAPLLRLDLPAITQRKHQSSPILGTSRAFVYFCFGEEYWIRLFVIDLCCLKTPTTSCILQKAPSFFSGAFVKVLVEHSYT